MPTVRRQGKPYIWVTWLAKACAGGQQCLYAPWFKAHYRYHRHQEYAFDLQKWNRDHDAMMRARREELEADGWTVTMEQANEFKLEGDAALVAGKPDIIAVKGTRVLVVDGKTGRQRESDIWQVLIYLYALLKQRPELADQLVEGEVQYRDSSVSLSLDELTPERLAHMVAMIRTIASDEPPAKAPSRSECRGCDIGVRDCPERVTSDQVVGVGDF